MLTVIRGDDATFELTFTDAEGNAIDLTGGTIFFTVKKKLDDDDDDAVIAKEIASFDNPATGVQDLELTNEETDVGVRSYWYDVQFKDAAGKITSSSRGRFTVTNDVTKRTV